MATLEALVFEAGRRREELRRRLEESENVWARVLRDPGAAHPAQVDETFTSLSSLRAELSAVEEREHGLGARLSDAALEREALRSVFHSVEDIAGSNGSPHGDEAALGEASRHLFEGREEQRRRVARDLREGPARSMVQVVDQAVRLDRLLREHSHLAAQELVDLDAGIRRILDSARRLVIEMEPTTLDDLGLLPTLRRVVRDFRNRTGIATELRVEGQEHGLVGAQGHALHRIVQEALDNVRRHSGAGSAEVVLTFLARGARVTIRDGGTGFDIIAVESALDMGRSFGLRSMRERAEAAGGTVQIQSQLGRGTEVRATFS